MSNILHLSDLHLGEPEQSQLLDDHKSLIAGGERRAQRDVLRETLVALGDEGVFNDLDAVVVSGDLTNRAGQAGFAEFREMMAPLVDAVGARNIVVVPGNHDVPWEHGPSDPDRYKSFLAVTRKLGMSTPLLDGIDISERDKDVPHLVAGEDFVIVPLNSSHFCWGMEPLDPKVFEGLLTDSDVAAAVDALRRHDVARISNDQIDALLELLREEDPKIARDSPDPRVRIATLHHQLLPVSAREELKTFESLSNLGAVRELLSQLGIGVVLHGHKHTSALFWDYVAYQGELNRAPRRILTCAAPARFLPGEPTMRLLRIGPSAAARDLEIEDVIAPIRGATKTGRRSQYARLWRSTAADEVGDAMVVRGENVSDVYARIRSLFAGRAPNRPIHDLVCEVADPGDASKVPTDFPRPEKIEDIQAWMDDLIAWWQLRDPQLLRYVTFNHGERIYRRWGDQTDRAVEALERASSRTGTTRAVIMLFDPLGDGRPTGEFPSFVLIQLQLVERAGDRVLDVTGYFRKQEMRYWWPINVAELAKVQGEVVERLTSGEDPVRRGRLRTIAAYAAAEERLPAVALAALDRAVDQRPEDIWKLAYGLAHPECIESSELLRLWESYLVELDPADHEPSGVLPVSYRGLGDVADILAWLELSHSAVGKALTDLVSTYESLQDQGRPVQAGPATVEMIRKKLLTLREALAEQIGPGRTG